MGHVGRFLASTISALGLATAPLSAQQEHTPMPPPSQADTAPSSSGAAVVRVATVAADRVYARCGPSTNYYPTAILKRGQQVRVLQVRPDGWAAIEPPPGSFCWVSGDFIRMVAPGTGEAIEDGVWVWIGSTVSPRRDHSQVTLKRGQRVRVLKSSVFPEDALQRIWLQIEPPEGEVRWVKAEYLQFDTAARAPEVPEERSPSPAAASPPPPESTQPATPSNSSDEQFALRLFQEAEDQFRTVIQQPPGQRELLPLKAKYQQVLRLTSNVALQKVVHGRLATIEREELRERFARRFIELLERSRAKDRQLLQLATTAQRTPAAQPAQGSVPRSTARSTAQTYSEFDRWFDDPFAPTAQSPATFTASHGQPQATAAAIPTAEAPPSPTPYGHTQHESASAGPAYVPRTSASASYAPAQTMATPSVSNRSLPPGYQMVTGVLHPDGTTPQGRARYVVRDPRSGRALGYVVEAPGLNLRPYIGKLIRITGRVLSPAGASYREVMARRVEPLVR